MAPNSPSDKQLEQNEATAGAFSASDFINVPQGDIVEEVSIERTESPMSPISREVGNLSQESEPDDIEITLNEGASQTSIRIPQPLLLTSTIARGAFHQCGTARRVKVYELSNETWQDRGTGYCAGVYDEGHDEALLVARMEDECLKIEGALPDPRRQMDKMDPLLPVEIDADSTRSETGPLPYYLIVSPSLDTEEILLKSRVVKEDVYQKQQDTLVVWTEPDGTDMALSFQEAEGCHEVWEFIVEVQKHFHLNTSALRDSFSDPPTPDPGSPQSGELSTSAFGMGGVNILDSSAFALPEPFLGNLEEIDGILKNAAAKGPGAREKIAEWIARSEYIRKLCPVFHDAEDVESLDSLHCLCSIMQTIIMLNDSMIIEAVLGDDVFLSVVGMFEYDPEFPLLKASYRDYFENIVKYKEVVEIEDPKVLTKIHQVYRLQYLKDVILVRVLDDAMFSVLNSWIFFHQFDIVNYCSGNEALLATLYNICGPESTEPVERKHDAIFFLQHLCAIGKQIQLPSRIALYRTLAESGILSVLEHAVFEETKKVQNAAAEMLMVIIEYDPNSVRNHVMVQVEKKRKTLISIMADLLHNVEDLGLKAQVAESLKTLFDNATENGPPNATLAAAAAAARTKGDPDQFLHWFYESDVEHLFSPLKQLPKVTTLTNDARIDLAPRHRSSLLGHLCDLLCYAVLQHTFRSQYFIITSQIATHVGALLFAREKHLQLAAIRFFRACIGSNNQFTNRYFIKVNIFGALLDLAEKESRRDNLVLSACLDLFEHLQNENVRPLTEHLLHQHEPRLKILSSTPFTAKCFSGILSAARISAESATATHPMPSSSGQNDSKRSDTQAAENERQLCERDLILRGMAPSSFDMDQDEYFNDDLLEPESLHSDETSEREASCPGSVTSLRKRKRNDPPAKRSLVPYGDLDDSSDSDREDEDAGTKEEIQKSPSGKYDDQVMMVDPLLDASTVNKAEEESHREKRLRDDHNDQEEVDAITAGNETGRADLHHLFDRFAQRSRLTADADNLSRTGRGDQGEEEGGFLRVPSRMAKTGSKIDQNSGSGRRLSLNLSSSTKQILTGAGASASEALQGEKGPGDLPLASPPHD